MIKGKFDKGCVSMNYLKNKLRFWMAVILLAAVAAVIWYVLAFSQVPDLKMEGTLVFLESERMVHV